MSNRPTFSQRLGIVPLKPQFQLTEVSDALRNRLWSLLTEHCFNNVKFKNYMHDFTIHSSRYGLLRNIWDHYFKLSVDTIPISWDMAIQQVREWFFKASWNNAFDMVDFVNTNLTGNEQLAFQHAANQILEQENSGFRFISGELAPITDKNEIESLNRSLEFTDNWKPVSDHLLAALSLLSDKNNPDFRNSIKESISAVESASRLLTGEIKATLGDATKLLERSGKLHPAMAKALSSLYGYTNDEGGIRHSMLDAPDLSYLDAKFILVVCSAFCNHLRGNAT